MDQARDIKALIDRGETKAAVETEHEAIEHALNALGEAMAGGASPKVLTQAMDRVLDFCEAHFRGEEQALRDSGYAAVESHAKDHERLLRELREARAAINGGQVEATIDACALLNCFHDHVATFDEMVHSHFDQKRELDRAKLAGMP